MLYAVRGNKQLKIDEKETGTYLALGYDIAKAEGNKLEIIKHSANKTVPFAQFEKVQDENDALKEQVKTLEKKLKESDKQNKEDKK